MKPLKARQERFCRRFAEFGCATTAARAAGGSVRRPAAISGAPAAAASTFADSEEMYTFVSAISLVESRRYGEFMSTFVYRLAKEVFSKIKHLTSKHVYFRLLLSTFHNGANWFRSKSMA